MFSNSTTLQFHSGEVSELNNLVAILSNIAVTEGVYTCTLYFDRDKNLLLSSQGEIIIWLYTVLGTTKIHCNFWV